MILSRKFSFLSSNPDFYSTLVKLSLPIVIQGFITTALTFVDVLMVGQLGSTAVASVGLGNQFTLIFLMLISGISSGAGIFTAQYWGKRYVKHIRQTFAIGLRYNLLAGVVFTVLTACFSRSIISFYTSDAGVIELGGHYLMLVGISYIFFAISSSYAAVLRSTKLVMIPLIASTIALIINTILNYGLILGKFGMPAVGVTGAGISMIVARFIECAILVVVVKAQSVPSITNVRSSLVGSTANHLREKYLKVALPVIIHSMGWVLGIAVYTRIYASLNTSALAAINISETLEKMGLMIFVGISNACAIMVGNNIGSGREDLARDYSRKFLFIIITGAIIIGGVLVLIRGSILSLYNLAPQEMHNVSMVLLFMSCVMWMKATNVVFNGGIFRSGGDTRFSMMLDIGGVWLVGIPLGMLAAYVLHFPVYYVALFIYTEELVKMAIGFYRFNSGKWLRNLVRN